MVDSRRSLVARSDRPDRYVLTIAFVAKRKFAPARKNSGQVLARGPRFS
jgi:hypothetical protein